MEKDIKLGFGGLIVSKDVRDYDLGTIEAISPHPMVYRPDYSSIPVDMQGKQPACGAHAISFLRAVRNMKNGIPDHRSPRFAWTAIKKVDGYPIESGTTINAALAEMVNQGICKFSLTGNDVTLSLTAYVNLSITNEMIDDAVNNKEESYAISYNPTMEALKQKIFDFGAVLMLLRVGRNMYTPTWKDCLPLSTKYKFDSGHFVVAIGYDENYIYFRNEWSEDWGDNGNGYFGEDYMPYVVAIGTVVDKEQIPTFYRDLTLGNIGNDVKALQVYLNTHGYPLTLSGIGSPGNESNYFGNLTKQAIIKLQIANGISPSVGYFGSKTRAWVISHP